MRFTSFRHNGQDSWGLVQGNEIADLGAVLRDRFADLRAAIAGGALAQANDTAGSAKRISLDAITYLPVIPNPGKIFCVGINYEEHRKETGRDTVGHPTIFTRFADSQAGHGTDLTRPTLSGDFDYEGELAIVIGKPGRHIDPKNAMQHIAGFACYNDGSIRDWQRHSHQFTPGKNFPNTGGFGPWMVTPDEITDLPNTRLTTKLNGQVLQDATVSQMIFDIPTVIAYCSDFTNLNPGDVIATGTPGGVGAKRTPPVWMKPGDTVEIEITGIGTLRNGIAAE